MQRRSWVSLLAVFGVLLHVGALTRHDAILIGAQAQIDALGIALSDICRGSLSAAAANDADLPQAPDPSHRHLLCTTCCVLADGFLLVAETELPAAPTAGSTQSATRVALPRIRDTTAWPPPRGPPKFS